MDIDRYVGRFPPGHQLFVNDVMVEVCEPGRRCEVCGGSDGTLVETLEACSYRQGAVVRWSAEQRTAYLGTDKRLDGRIALFHEDRRGEGRPLLGLMSIQRQREVVLLRRCQVCRRPLGRRGYAVVLPHVRFVPELGMVPLLTEPLACRDCMTFSLVACPGLQRAKPPVVRVTRFLPVLEFVAPLDDPRLDRDFEPLRRKDFPAQGAVGLVKLQLLDYSVVNLGGTDG